MSRQLVTIDGNEAAAYVAHKCSEVCIIYPITPSSPMGEHSDEWSAQGKTNLWGTVPEVGCPEIQVEGIRRKVSFDEGFIEGNGPWIILRLESDVGPRPLSPRSADLHEPPTSTDHHGLEL